MTSLYEKILPYITSDAARTGAWLVFFIVFIMGVARGVRASVRRRVVDVDTRYRLQKTVTGVATTTVFLVIMFSMGGKLTGLSVALGAASAGIAFALQEVIASIGGWLALSFGSFYGIGDRVQVGGIRGDVIDIGVLRTTIMEMGGWVDGDLYNGRMVRIANSFVFKEPVFNYSGEFSFVWDEIKVPIRYGSDYARARGVIEQCAAAELGDYAERAGEEWAKLVRRYRIEDARTEPMVSLVANDNWVELTLRYVVDCKARRGTKDRLFTRLLDEIAKTDGAVQLASATFEVTALPALDLGDNLGQRGARARSSS